MALEGPRLIYTRSGDETTDKLHRALRLAREVEELLEDTSSTKNPDMGGVQSTRIVRAMAASLVDELEAFVRGARKSRLA
jgi:hypothetical protein